MSEPLQSSSGCLSTLTSSVSRYSMQTESSRVRTPLADDQTRAVVAHWVGECSNDAQPCKVLKSGRSKQLALRGWRCPVSHHDATVVQQHSDGMDRNLRLSCNWHRSCPYIPDLYLVFRPRPASINSPGDVFASSSRPASTRDEPRLSICGVRESKPISTNHDSGVARGSPATAASLASGAPSWLVLRIARPPWACWHLRCTFASPPHPSCVSTAIARLDLPPPPAQLHTITPTVLTFVRSRLYAACAADLELCHFADRISTSRSISTFHRTHFHSQI
nr:hypothetical protein CFP56_77855 [Quercus suber]